MDEIESTREATQQELSVIATEFNIEIPEGGIRLSYENGGYVFAPTFPLPTTDRKGLIQEFGNSIGLDYETTIQSMRGEDSAYKQAYEFFIEGGDMNHGFVGVTHRNRAWFVENNPAFLEKLNNLYGKIVFVGNGLSTLPLELIEENHDITEIILVDMIDIEVVSRQLNELASDFTSRGLTIPLQVQERLESIKKLTTPNSKVRFEKRTFGATKEPSLHFGTADFVINSFGPPSSTEEEQKRYLSDENANNRFITT